MCSVCYVCVCVLVYACVYIGTQGTRSPEAGDIGLCEKPDMVDGSPTLVL